MLRLRPEEARGAYGAPTGVARVLEHIHSDLQEAASGTTEIWLRQVLRAAIPLYRALEFSQGTIYLLRVCASSCTVLPAKLLAIDLLLLPLRHLACSCSTFFFSSLCRSWIPTSETIVLKFNDIQ